MVTKASTDASIWRCTGLYYYRARYYDPKIGRFISEDPIKFEAGPNFYTYVDNNPTNYTDPTGLEAGSEGQWQWRAGGGVYVPSCPSPCRAGCMNRCLTRMNPFWPLAGAGGVALKFPVVGTVATGWTGLTIPGCFWACLINPCGVPDPPTTFPW